MKTDGVRIQEKKAEVRAAAELCATAAHQMADEARRLAEAHLLEPPEAVNAHHMQQALESYRTAAVGLQKLRNELTALATQRPKLPRWGRHKAGQ